MAKNSFTVDIDNNGTRLDKFLAKSGYGFALAQKMIRQKQIKVNGHKESADYRLQTDDQIEIFANFTSNFTFAKKTSDSKTIDQKKLKLIKAAIIFKDDNLLAIDKPQGIAVQGGSKIGFSINDALPYLKFEKEETPRLVHRLDKDTSGVLLIARNRATADLLIDAFRNKTIEKTYLAHVKGSPSNQSGTISIPLIKKFSGQSEKVYKDETLGKEAITHYQILENYGDYSLLELKPVTGRTHQIRVHCKEIGHPIIGDSKYGGKNAFIDGLSNRLHLHSFKILINDFYGKKLEIVTKAPDFI